MDTDLLAGYNRGFALSTIECSCYEPKKKDWEATEVAATTHNTDTESVTVVKATVIDPKIKRIKTILNQARNYHYKQTRPWAGRKVGILRGDQLLEYAQKMNGFIKEFDEAVEEAAASWGQTVAAQAARLNGLFRIEDYPTAEQFRNKFSLRYYIDQLPSKADWLLDVPVHVVEELAGSFEEQMTDRINELKQSVLDETKTVLQNAAKILRKGNPQSIRNALVDNVRKSADWIRDLNVGDDDGLQSIVIDIETDIVNVGADELRENDTARDNAQFTARRVLRRIEAIR